MQGAHVGAGPAHPGTPWTVKVFATGERTFTVVTGNETAFVEGLEIPASLYASRFELCD